MLKRYVVFHNYGSEGWKVAADSDSVLEAVEAREADVANGGGESLIFECLGLFEAYRDALYEVERQEREAAKAAAGK